MNLFYTTSFENQIAVFETDEARHLHVLRKKEGDMLQFTDGEGNLYTGIISSMQRNSCYVEITNKLANYQPNPYKLHIAIAPTKNADRLEWFLEKATEIGISSIIPVICQHSERDKLRMDRLEGILISSMKQSLQAYLPKLYPLQNFNDFIAEWSDYEGSRAIAWCGNEGSPFISTIRQSSSDYLVCIGPEGDFSTLEVELALQNKFQQISLGKNRLRTETAGVFTAATIASWHY